MPDALFRNRAEAGRILADRLGGYGLSPADLILALPRGGVPVAFEIATKFAADLDVFVVRKLGVPGQEELAMGAIASGGVRVINHGLIRYLTISSTLIDEVTARERREIERREKLYRDGRPALPITGRSVVLVDDGLATGASMLAAVRAVKAQHPDRVLVAVPVASREACEEFRREVHAVICAETPQPFLSVGAWYEDFAQTSDAEVKDLLGRRSHERVA
jgi:putative phosphoribosyl transferase